jgi:hypothetical protein
MKSMCCLCIQFIHENISERTILHQVNKKNSGGGGQTPPDPLLPGLVACTAKKASYAPDDNYEYICHYQELYEYHSDKFICLK